MKLRLRSLETKETLKLEIPSPSTLHQLQQILFRSISPPPLPPPNSSSLYFSLNRKEPLPMSSPHDSLLALGVTSGDLVYFSTNPLSFSGSSSSSSSSSSSQTVIQQEPNKEDTVVSDTQMGKNPENREPSRGNPVQDLALTVDVSVVSDTQMGKAKETMDIDSFGDEKNNETCFLGRVLKEELSDGASDHELLVVAVHAVLLESGFIRFDQCSGTMADRLHLREDGPFSMSLWYTLSTLWGKVNESVVLKFQSLGHYINVYGSLVNGESTLHHVSLDNYRFKPILDLLWVHGDEGGKMDDNRKKEFFEFWKIVKDGLALPLLIDLCEKTGLASPPCLMGLPKEIKVKILESLPGVDLAKMECVCREMQHLASNNNLWKLKLAEEFEAESGMNAMISWKKNFVILWETKKKREKALTPWRGFPHVDRPFYLPRNRRDPFPFRGPPMIIGGDHDLLPGLGVPPLFGCPSLGFPRRRRFSPSCNLGGFNA